MHPITFDITGAGIRASAARLRPGAMTAPDGRTWGVTTTALTLDGEPFAAVSGEFLPQRYPLDEWEDALRALRDGGVTVVSSYLFWGLVEPRRGEFDLTGSNDIGRLADLCAELGLLFAPRIGPFDNSEYLLGGLPPWLYGTGATERSNDPLYLDLVEAYFAAVAENLAGRFWKDGGPIVMVQLENELTHAPNDWRTLFGYTATDHRGPTGRDFAAHMVALRERAERVGILPPFFTMTGWGTAGALPEGELLPSYGAYMDLHPNLTGVNRMHTTFVPGEHPLRGRFPVLFCELGTGSPSRAAYRSMTPAEAMTTTALTRFASTDSIFLGYYLFHGGTNPVRGDGFGWTIKEDGFTLRSYDFWAPVSEFGERRRSFFAAGPLNRFVTGFGGRLASMEPVSGDVDVTDPAADELRTIVRADSGSGFVFLTNWGDVTRLSDREDVRLRVVDGDKVVVFPVEAPLDIASGEQRVLPFEMPLADGVTLRWSTAQPLALLEDGAGIVLVAHAPAGTRVEHAVRGGLVPDSARVLEDGAAVIAVEADAEGSVTVSAEPAVRIVTIPTEVAERIVEVEDVGRRVLVSSDVDVTPVDVDADGAGSAVEVSALRALGDTESLEAEVAVVGGEVRRLAASVPPAVLDPDAISVRRIDDARVVLTAPGLTADEVSELWVDVTYEGDLCRLFDTRTGLLEGDDFQRGIPWRVKLGRFADALTGSGLLLRVEPVASASAAADAEGILLDRAEKISGRARVVDLAFAQRMTARIELPPFQPVR